jgi:hypothetical protein
MDGSIGSSLSCISLIGRSLVRALGLGGRAALAATVLLAGAAVAPPAAQAQNVCNGLINLNYMSGPPFALAGDTYRVEVALGTGTISGGAMNQLTVSRFRFQLDCQNFAFIGCTDEGDIIRYISDATITDTNCVDAGDNDVTWTSNGVDSPVGPNQVVFTPSSPVVIGANTLPANGCRIEFDVRVQTAPGLDGSPTIVQESVGYDPMAPFDATCDNGLSSSANQNGQVFLCPECLDDECVDGACNQNTGMCEGINAPESTPCQTDSDLCTTEHCDGLGECVLLSTVMCPAPVPPCEGGAVCDPETGMCVPQPDAEASTPCTDNDGNVCTVAGCDGAGACDQQHVLPDSTPCPDTGNACAVAGCDGAGNCDQTHVPAQDSTPCDDSDGNVCTVAGCDGAGNCDQQHTLPDSTPCPDTEEECAVAGCDGAGSCDQAHVPSPDSTPCGDTDGDPCTTAGCDAVGSCDQAHITNPDAECGGDHYKCYRSRADFDDRTVTLEDQFGPTTATVRRPDRFCNPVNKNNEGINDPTAHLNCYRIREPRGPNRRVIVTNQIGEQRLTAGRTHSLCVPAIKDQIGDLDALDLNHFKCYRVHRSHGEIRFEERDVQLVDQFEEKNTTVTRPFLLCNPVNKNGEGVPNPSRHLTCYKITDVAGQPPFEPEQPNVTDQFVMTDLQTMRRTDCSQTRILCLPSSKRIASPSGAFLDRGDALL